jgi:DNA-binding MarR family transcriptional regulator
MMVEQDIQENQKDTREYLLQRTVEQLFSVMRKINRDVSPHKHFLSPPQARLVFIISRFKEEGISVKELAERSAVTPGAITQFVDVLIAKDLVKREADLNDRRIVRLKVTPAAESRLQKLKEEFFTSAARTFGVLQDDELKHLIDLLARVGSQKSDV